MRSTQLDLKQATSAGTVVGIRQLARRFDQAESVPQKDRFLHGTPISSLHGELGGQARYAVIIGSIHRICASSLSFCHLGFTIEKSLQQSAK